MQGDTAIKAITVAAYTVPTDAPEADGTFAWDATTMVVVVIRAGGQSGVGWTYGPAAVADLIRTSLAGIVLHRDAMDTSGCFTAMVRSVRNIGRYGVGGQAISAMDTALWDLKATLLDLPLYRLLGTDQTAVPIYGSGGFTTYDDHQLVDQLQHWTRSLGTRSVKIKVGESFGAKAKRDLARMRTARATVGPEVALMVDANGGYCRKQAVQVMRDAEDLAVSWLEEPVSSDDIDGLRAVRDTVDADVAAGEYGYDTYYFRRLCEARAVDCLQVDASRCGGITGWRQAAAVAEAHGLDVSGHCAPYLHRHVAAATPNLRHLEWFHDHVRIEQMAFDGTDEPADGALPVSADRTGTGLAFREADMSQYRVS